MIKIEDDSILVQLENATISKVFKKDSSVLIAIWYKENTRTYKVNDSFLQEVSNAINLYKSMSGKNLVHLCDNRGFACLNNN